MHCGVSGPFNSLMEKQHLVISFLWYFFFPPPLLLESVVILFEYILIGFLWLSGFGCNSIYKSCYQKPLYKLYTSLICHLCKSVPKPPQFLCCSSVAWVRADALSELFSHGFAGPGAAASEKSPKESICCVLIAVQLDPMQMWQC